MTDRERPAEASTHIEPPASPEAPRAIGRYRLERVIAAGGMGTVYLALQDKPHRAVALKLLTRGLSSATSARRFESEAQILGHLHHPGIAQVYDAGMHDDGTANVPYFVMEYVPNGKGITEYADANELDQRERVELLARVCDAVDHGHQRGIVHRDLKPANILVDADGNPKVIDFGVARVTDSDLAATTHRTAVGELVGTVQYMSPEQVDANPDDIDGRSDVYSLGVVLYELLCGALPYDLDGKPLHVATHLVRETPPRRLSTVDGTLRGDLETIVTTAMHRNRQRRYRAAGDLASDLRRYLGGEPIAARREQVAAVVGTHARREIAKHPFVSWLAAVVVAALAARYVGVPLFYRWTPLHRIIEKMILINVTPDGLGGAVESVKLITLADATDPAALAVEIGVAGVSNDDVTSVRRLHGRLMERLSRAGVRVVVFDISFRGETAHDAGFVAGVRALREREIDVVVAVADWQRDDEGLPDTSSTILASGVRWGAATGLYNATGPWSLDLLLERDGRAPMPSLALAAHAAQRWPGADVALELDREWGSVEATFSRDNPDVPHARRFLGDPERIALSAVDHELRTDTRLGLERGDIVGTYVLDVPDEAGLAAITLEYADVLLASDVQLRDWLADRVVVIGNARNGVDLHPYVGGRRIYGCYAHAVGIDALSRGVTVRFPRPWQVIVVLLAGAMLGGLVAVLVRGSAWRRLLVLGAVAVLGIAVAVMAYRQASYLFNPVIPIVAMLLAAWLASRLVRLRALRA
ncbi:MAG: protein kinase domain-containing protein [Planctomycetota bacterium]|jgi:hypothetical protein